MVIDAGWLAKATGGATPPFLVAGSEATGEYYCTSCGYGVTVRRALPQCPMCGGETWQSGFAAGASAYRQ